MSRAFFIVLLIMWSGSAFARSEQPLAEDSASGPSEVRDLQGRFAGWAEIDAQGRLQAFAPDGYANAAVVAAIREQLRAIVFSPRVGASGHIPVRTWVRGTHTLTEDQNGYVLRISGIAVGPKPVRMQMPEFPIRVASMDEATWLRARFVIGSDGAPVDIMIEDQGGSSETRRSVKNTLLLWRFEPETSEGRPLQTVLRQEFVYHAAKSSPSVPPCPADDTGRVLAPGQRSCNDRIEFRLDHTRLGREVRVP